MKKKSQFPPLQHITQNSQDLKGMAARVHITGGTLKGLRLLCPPQIISRPTSTRAREALFSCLFSMDKSLKDACILDGFAGSGVVGFECLSRGAAHVFFIENNKLAQRILKENAICSKKQLNISVISKFSSALIMSACSQTQKNKARKCDSQPILDMIYLDPPYFEHVQGVPLYQKALRYVMPLLKTDGLVVIETDMSEQVTLEDVPLVCVKEKVYGRIKLWFFKHKR